MYIDEEVQDWNSNEKQYSVLSFLLDFLQTKYVHRCELLTSAV